MEEKPLARGWPGQSGQTSIVVPAVLAATSARFMCLRASSTSAPQAGAARRLPAVIPSALGLIPSCHNRGLSGLRRQGFDYTALGHGAALALAANAAQFLCQAAKIGNLLFHCCQMLKRDLVNSAAIPLAIFGQGQQLAHLIDAEP
jgi:hypothetical protein